MKLVDSANVPVLLILLIHWAGEYQWYNRNGPSLSNAEWSYPALLHFSTFKRIVFSFLSLWNSAAANYDNMLLRLLWYLDSNKERISDRDLWHDMKNWSTWYWLDNIIPNSVKPPLYQNWKKTMHYFKFADDETTSLLNCVRKTVQFLSATTAVKSLSPERVGRSSKLQLWWRIMLAFLAEFIFVNSILKRIGSFQSRGTGFEWIISVFEVIYQIDMSQTTYSTCLATNEPHI